MELLDSNKYYYMLMSGLRNLKLHEEEVNSLNVFPIPDGDTGKNMRMTLEGGINNISDSSEDISLMSKELGRGMLMSARGNSGVILSQFFAGMENGFKGETLPTLDNIKLAFSEGVKKAYNAVINPVEGTILTVIREASEKTNTLKLNSIEEFFNEWLNSAKVSLANTTNLLKELKEANVIDSGGQGIVYIVEGMYEALLGKEIKDESLTYNENEINPNLFTSSMTINFGYCTEVLVRLQDSKCDIENFSADTFIEYLKTIGDSIVCFKDGSIIKVHVHTLTPYKVLEFAQKYGEFLKIKIENMDLQNEAKKELDLNNIKEIKRNIKRVKYASVAVASGSGVKDAFESFGVDYVIDGGQTENPSSEDFVEAFKCVNADNIFVFPNNSNIILAANNAKDLYKDSNIIIIPTKNIGQGYASLSMIDYSSDNLEEIEENFIECINEVDTILISRAIRDAFLNNVSIKAGDFIAISKGEVISSESDIMNTIEFAMNSIDVSRRSMSNIIVGKSGISDKAEEIKEILTKKYMLETDFSYGGQDVYDYILVIE